MGLPQLDVHLGEKMSPKSIKDLHIRNKALAILQLKKKKKNHIQCLGEVLYQDVIP